MSGFDLVILFIYIVFDTIVTTGAMYMCICIVTKTDFVKSKSKLVSLFSVLFALFIINKTLYLYFPAYYVSELLALLISCTFAIRYIFKASYAQSFISVGAYFIVFALSKLIYILLLNTLTVEVVKITSNYIYISTSGFTITILKAIIASIAFMIYRKTNSPFAISSDKIKYILPQMVVVVICLVPTFVILVMNKLQYPIIVLVVNLIQLLAVSVVSVCNVKKSLDHEKTKEDLYNALIHNSTLQKVNESVRGFKHDMSNIVQAILGYIALNDSEGAKAYCQNLVIGFKDINLLTVLSPNVINDPGTYGVVATKLLAAREKGLDISLDISCDFTKINFPSFELSRSLGILLDNAIEASEVSNRRKIELNMFHSPEKRQDIIVVSNSVKDFDFDIDKLFEKDYSTKENPSGFGLYEIAKFLNKYTQAVIYPCADKTNNMFSQTLIINYNC